MYNVRTAITLLSTPVSADPRAQIACKSVNKSNRPSKLPSIDTILRLWSLEMPQRMRHLTKYRKHIVFKFQFKKFELVDQ